MAFGTLLSLPKTLQPLATPARTDILRLRGPCKYGDETLEAIYVGTQTNLEFLRGLFFCESRCEPLDSQRFPMLAARRARGLYATQAKLLLTDVPRLWHVSLGLRPQVELPAWVRQEIFLEGRTEPRLWSRDTEKEIGRHLRRRQYEIDITTDPAEFLVFFHNLYRPYVESRFGAEAVVVKERAFVQATRGQSLARVKARGQWVAGMLLSQRRGSLRFGWFGAAANPPPNGVSDVLDAFCIRYARERGFKRVILGNSRPNLNDGVVRYKAKFGARVVPTLFPQSLLGINILGWSEGIAKCFAAQPLVAHSAGRCHAYRLQGIEPGNFRLSLDPL